MLFGFIGFCLFATGVIMLVITLIKRGKKKKSLVLISSGIILFFVGIATDEPSDNKVEKALESEISQKVEAEEKTEEKENKEKNANKKKEKSKPKKSYAIIGEVLTVDKVDYTLNEISSSPTINWSTLSSDANGIYLIAGITIKNNSDKSIILSSDYFTVINSESKFDSDYSATMYANEYKMITRELNPGLSTTYNIAFDVTQEVLESPETFIQAQTGIWGTKTGLMKVNN